MLKVGVLGRLGLASRGVMVTELTELVRFSACELPSTRSNCVPLTICPTYAFAGMPVPETA